MNTNNPSGIAENGMIEELGPAWHYIKIKKVSAGGYGEVWCARWQEGNEEVTLKIPRLAECDNPVWEQSIRQGAQVEIDVLQRLFHPHIVAYRHHGQRQGVPILVMEPLAQDLDNWRKTSRTLSQQLEVLLQLAQAISYLHQQQLCHLDLKPGNILFTAPEQTEYVKLIDFGNVRPAGSKELALGGSPGWLSPEQLMPVSVAEDGNPLFHVDIHADWYCFGMIMFYLLTSGGETAFASLSRSLPNLLDLVQTKQVEIGLLAAQGLTKQDQQLLHDALSQWTDYPLAHITMLEDLLSQLLRHPPEQRPAAKTVMATLNKIQYGY